MAMVWPFVAAIIRDYDYLGVNYGNTPKYLTTLDRTTGHLNTYTGVVVTRLRCHMRGRICRGLLDGLQILQRT